MATSVGRGVREKLSRANIHRQAFECNVERWRNSSAYTITRNDDIQAGERHWQFWLNEPIPQVEWGVIIGDSLFNFRSALDHLAFDLATAYTKTLTEKQEGDSEIGAIDPQARKRIEDMQPYGRKDRAILGHLDRLHNLDKHRTLHLVAASTTALAHVGDMTFTRLNFDPLEDGDVIAVAPLDSEGDPNPYIRVSVAFSKPSSPSAGAVLGWVDTHIRERVIPDLLRFP